MVESCSLNGPNLTKHLLFIQIFTMVVVFGLFHGLFFLPCILSLIGPRGPLDADESPADKSPAAAQAAAAEVSAATSRAASSSPEAEKKGREMADDNKVEADANVEAPQAQEQQL